MKNESLYIDNDPPHPTYTCESIIAILHAHGALTTNVDHDALEQKKFIRVHMTSRKSHVKLFSFI